MTAFEEGKKARLKGKPLSANPHGDKAAGLLERPAAYREWAEGWHAADDLLRPKPAPDAHLGSRE